MYLFLNSKEQIIPNNYYSDDSYNASLNTSHSTLVGNSIPKVNVRKASNVYTSLKSASDLRNSSYSAENNNNNNNNINSDYYYTDDNRSEILDSFKNDLDANTYDSNNNNEKYREFTSSKRIHQPIQNSDDKLIDLDNEDFYYDSDDTKVIIAKSLTC